MPTFYPLASLYLVKHSPDSFGAITFATIVTLGVAMIVLNYWSDQQRQMFRATGGKCTIWGKPAKAIHAVYENENGERKRSTLLVSGFWGMARHFNYVFELGNLLNHPVRQHNYATFQEPHLRGQSLAVRRVSCRTCTSCFCSCCSCTVRTATKTSAVASTGSIGSSTAKRCLIAFCRTCFKVITSFTCSLRKRLFVNKAAVCVTKMTLPSHYVTEQLFFTSKIYPHAKVSTFDDSFALSRVHLSTQQTDLMLS